MVVVDANILVSSNNLQRNPWKSLAERQQEWGFRFVVPEVALLEAVHRIRDNWRKEFEKLAAVRIGPLDLGDMHQDLAELVAKKIDDLEQSLRDGFGEMGASLVEPPQIPYMDIVQRAIYQTAPYGPKSPDSFRDAVIWHTLLSVAEANPDAEVWFVSNNVDDFGPKNGNWTGEGRGKRDDCPLLFDPTLQQELVDRELSNRVHYVTGLRRLELHFASRFTPIDTDEFDKLISQLDHEKLSTRLSAAVDGLALNPRSAALELHTVAGEVSSSRVVADTWDFNEPARTNTAGWTARFSVDAEVDIETVDEHLAEGTTTKTLRLAGDLTVSADHTVCDLGVTTASALPDDPMRAQWIQRNQRHHSAGGHEALAGLLMKDPVGSAAAVANLQAVASSIAANSVRESGVQAILNSIAANSVRESGVQAILNSIAANSVRESGVQAITSNFALNTLGAPGFPLVSGADHQKRSAADKAAAKA
ncbi:PIN domain-containing protein, partial [Nocardia shimofusensis]|uniref:PIN domain-containing protein n=1 Tax=Nocardia shimofusensis TaxID=228596 RepID=UPI001FE03E58